MKLWTFFVALLFVAGTSSLATAWNDGDDTSTETGSSEQSLYWQDRICYAQTDVPGGWLVAVVDTFEIGWTINAGTTSAYMLPCIPTACPEPWHLISGNVCSMSDPFAHIPIEPDRPAPTPTTTPLAESIDVGPLVEPFTPTTEVETP